jgi:hypothetical protein
MRPIWNAVRQQASKDIVFKEVDCDVINVPHITGYPTILMVADHKTYKYGGPADYQQLYKWVMTIKPEYAPV